MPDPSEPANPFQRSTTWRAGYRARNHETAHANQAGSEPPPAPPKHPLIHRGKAAVVSDAKALDQLIAHLRGCGAFAYDSEFIGELTYVPKLCLIQVASPEQIALIDPLAELDLQPFWELLADPSVEKVVHAGEQDVEPVIRHIGKEPGNLFDTQLAAGLIGMSYPVALSKLVRELIGVRLGKALTFSHWDQRPLSAIQLRYAADDVRYLPAVRAEIGRRLDALGHSAWAKEECAALCDASRYGFDPDGQYLRLRGIGSLSPRNLAVLRELTIWRDAAARLHNVPARSLVHDSILIDLARSPVPSVEALAKVRGLPRPVEHAHGKELVEATNRALAMTVSDLPSPRQLEESPTERFRADSVWALVQSLCFGLSIDPALVASRQEAGQLSQALAESAPLPDLRLLKGWRKQAVGQALLDILHGQRRAHLFWTQGSLHAQPAPSSPD